MEGSKIVANKTFGKIKIFIALFLLVISISINFYQNKIINHLRTLESSEQSEFLSAATESFKQYYKDKSNNDLDADMMRKFSHSQHYDNTTNSWIVEFRYTVDGNSATTKYVFTVKNNYIAKFKSVSQFGSL